VKVWVLQRQAWETGDIAGVYSTPEKAMAALPDVKTGGGWRENQWGDYSGYSSAGDYVVEPYILDEENR
jgi:hypothetical protein